MYLYVYDTEYEIFSKKSYKYADIIIITIIEYIKVKIPPKFVLFVSLLKINALGDVLKKSNRYIFWKIKKFLININLINKLYQTNIIL